VFGFMYMWVIVLIHMYNLLKKSSLLKILLFSIILFFVVVILFVLRPLKAKAEIESLVPVQLPIVSTSDSDLDPAHSSVLMQTSSTLQLVVKQNAEKTAEMMTPEQTVKVLQVNDGLLPVEAPIIEVKLHQVKLPNVTPITFMPRKDKPAVDAPKDTLTSILQMPVVDIIPMTKETFKVVPKKVQDYGNGLHTTIYKNL
jgi:hypothetical protein